MSSADILTKKPQIEAESSVEVDYVLVFDCSAADKSDYAQVEREFTKVTQALSEAGLKSTSRPGSSKSNEILIFVKASESRLHVALQAQDVNDWLLGISQASRPDPKELRNFIKEPVTPAERLRLVHDIITGEVDVPKDQVGPGAGIVPGSEAFPRVKSLFPPHDPKFNQQWLSQWTTSSSLFSIKEEELVQIKNHFGENIALYFEFLRFYFASLTVPAAIGLTTWWFGLTFSPLYSVLLVAWSLLFVEGWRIREDLLAVRWGTKNAGSIGRKRTQFKGDYFTEDPDTGRKKRSQLWWKHESRVLVSVPVILAFGAGLCLLISAIFTLEVLINEVYNGPGKQYLSLLPTVLFAGIVPQVVAAWHSTAKRLTDYEDHELESTYDKSLTLKTFCLSAIPAFGNLTLSAYVYIPFGRLIVPKLLHYFHATGHLPDTASTLMDDFSINSARLSNTLFALTTTSQIIGAFSETVIPLVSRIASSKVGGGGDRAHTASTDSPHEAAFLQRIRQEASLPPYELFGDYAEMIQQFGYVVLWSVVWPLVPLMAWINNFFELRGDAFKICVNQRRPVPQRTETIGPWLDALGFITWLAAFVNSSLIYMFKPRSFSQRATVAAKLAHAVNNTLPVTTFANDTFQSTTIYQAAAARSDPFASICSTLFWALFIGLASEHVYMSARWLTRHVLRHVLWHQSPERIGLDRSNYWLKRQYLGARELEAAPHGSARTGVQDEATGTFWDASNDLGLAEIQRLEKAE